MRSDSHGSPPLEWHPDSPLATERVAESLVPMLQPDTLIRLEGELGAGKTTFVRGLARALGVTEPIRSPSFALVYEYPIRQPQQLAGLPLIHVDLYRIETPEALATLGLDELIERRGVMLIEWAERLRVLGYTPHPQHLWTIRFTVQPDNTRLIQWYLNKA